MLTWEHVQAGLNLVCDDVLHATVNWDCILAKVRCASQTELSYGSCNLYLLPSADPGAGSAVPGTKTGPAVACKSATTFREGTGRGGGRAGQETLLTVTTAEHFSYFRMASCDNNLRHLKGPIFNNRTTVNFPCNDVPPGKKKRSLYAECHYIWSAHACIMALCIHVYVCMDAEFCILFTCVLHDVPYLSIYMYWCTCGCAACLRATQAFAGACFVTCLLGTSRLRHCVIFFNSDSKTVKMEWLSLYSQWFRAFGREICVVIGEVSLIKMLLYPKDFVWQ